MPKPRDPFRLPGLPRGPRPPKLGPLRVFKREPVQASRPSAPTREQGFPDPPAGWAGGLAAWALYWAHGPLQRGPEGEAWAYATPLFGDASATGVVPDFLEFDYQIAIDVIDPARVDEQGPLGPAGDLRAAILAHFGYQHMVIDEALALDAPIYALREALNGVSHSQHGG